MNATSLLTAATVIIGMLIVAAGAIGTWAALRVGKNTGVVAQFKGAAEASTALAASYKAQMDEQVHQIADLQRQISDKDKEIKVLQGQMDILRDLVTGRPAFDEMSTHLEELTRRVDERTAEMLTQVNESHEEIRNVHESVEAIAVNLAKGVRSVR